MQYIICSLSQFSVFNVTVQKEDIILAATLLTSSYISFSLHSLIENRKLDKMDIYACFVDFRKALAPYQENMCMVHKKKGL